MCIGSAKVTAGYIISWVTYANALHTTQQWAYKSSKNSDNWSKCNNTNQCISTLIKKFSWKAVQDTSILRKSPN